MMMRLIKINLELFFNFKFTHFTSFNSLVQYLYQPRDASSLGIMRILFGMLMLIDVIYERGGFGIVARWGNPNNCHFPLFTIMRPPRLIIMGLIYVIMWLGALGITLGYKFKYTTAMFMCTYWYILLMDKSHWNNHSYLFGLVSVLLLGSSAHFAYSLDAFLDKSQKRKNAPHWNYFILRFQFFLLYFLAGLKKIDLEWLGGHAMVNWGSHWVFDPFKYFLTSEMVDYLIIHLCGFLLDLTLGFWLLSDFTRSYAIFFSTAFHLMNSRLFSIGMFPYVCIATTPIFCDYDWPVKIQNWISCCNDKNLNEEDVKLKSSKCRRRVTTILIIIHCCLQCFLPYSHFITKGYNNWTNGLYGYSWDMMVHSWDSALVVIRVRDNFSNKDHYLSPTAWTRNERWSKHADMCVQYANCLKENLANVNNDRNWRLSDNISVYIDVWCSLNGRFQQRMFDPNYDLLKANWSPFAPVEWLLPLLSENSEFRSTLRAYREHVYSWSNYSDALFIADFPGMHLENFLSDDLRNVTLNVLKGEIFFTVEELNHAQSLGVKLRQGSNYMVDTGMFHKIFTVGSEPSLYMYTYFNQTKEQLDKV